MPGTKFPWLTILLFCKRRLLRIKETNGKNLGFCVEIERERKTLMVKVKKSCHQVTWAQKSMTKKRELH